MNIDPQLLASVRAECDCLREDLRHMERGEWRGATPRDVQLMRAHLRRLATLVLLNEWEKPKPH